MTRIVIFAKQPVPGRVKTRLIPALGEEGAAKMARRMLDWTLLQARDTGLPVELCGDPDPISWYKPRPGLDFTAQGEGDLGERLDRAARRVLASGPVLFVGSDCPELGRSRLLAAAESLSAHDAVIHPALDGGYVLLGLRRFDPSLFTGIAWSTDSVAAQTIARIEALGWSLHVGERLRDVDSPGDLPVRFAPSPFPSCRI
jgi:rSAM/selenodomain-associated transferase 1